MAEIENHFPQGWDEKRVQNVLDHYENQTEEDAIIEDENAFNNPNTVMEIPKKLLPEVRRLLARNAS